MFKRSYYIAVFLIAGLLFSFPAFAGWEVPQMLNFGTLIKANENSNAVFVVNPDGTTTTSSNSNIGTVSGYYNGVLRYNNTSSSKVKIKKVTAATTATLSCVSNCSSGSCSVGLKTFRSSPSLPNGGNTQINANSYKDWNIGGTVATIPANCTGVFEGNITFTADGVTVNMPSKIIVGNIPTVTVTAQDDLDFGDILSTTASTVTVGTNGSRTCSPSSVCVGNQSQRGSFLVENSSSTAQTFTVDCPTGSVSMASGSNNFYINSFVCSASSNQVSSGSPATVSVGATLHVPQGQASGQYNTTYTITVNN